MLQRTGRLVSAIDRFSEAPGQVQRWLYFVYEYLQPKRSGRYEHYITIIASHGNLLTAFHHIIENVVLRDQSASSLLKLELPKGTSLLHAQVMWYQTIGTRPINLVDKFRMDEIPITVNHAQLTRDEYFYWAREHHCRVTERRSKSP